MLRDTIIRKDSSSINYSTEGIAYFSDPTRGNRSLSIDRSDIYFGNNHKNITTERWLNTITNKPSNLIGHLIKRDSLITSITINTKSIITDCDFKIYKSNNTNLIHTENITGSSYKIIDNLNIEVNKEDILSVLLSVNIGTVSYPEFNIEFAYRF